MANMHRFPGRAPDPAANSPTSVPEPVVGLVARDRFIIWGALIAITALAWVYLFYLDRQMSPAMEQATAMTGMDTLMEKPWNITDAFIAFAMWSVMMTGMMVPAATPVMLVFAGAHARRDGRRIPLTVLFFGLGYITVWIGFSSCAALAQWALHHAASPLAATIVPSAQGAQISGAILIAVGVYQLTPFKHACLRHCQSPLGFLMTHWRSGKRGAWYMGMRHGAYCLGCCWALMGVLFVVGVMNLVWVAALTLLVLLEKLGPAGTIVARAAGVVMIVTGILYFSGLP